MKMKLPPTLSTVLLAFPLVPLIGCSVLKPKVDPTKFYVLRSQPSASLTQAPPGHSEVAIRIGPWGFPDYLSSTPIMVDEGTNRVKRLDYHHWAEPLEKGVSRLLADTLSQLLNVPKVVVYPEDTAGPAGYEVRYHVFKFEGSLHGPVTLAVFWEVNDRKNQTTLVQKRSRYVIPPVGDPHEVEDYVGQMAAAVEQWAQEIAQAVSKPN